MLLLGVLTVAARVAWTGAERIGFDGIPRRSLWALPVTLAVCITGAFAALGDTLFPAISFSSGFHADFSSQSSPLLHLRLTHPFFAILGAAYLVWVAIPLLQKGEGSAERRAGARVLGITLFQLVVGAMNITLLTPIWTQLFHLFMADLLWIGLVLMVLESVRAQTQDHELVFKPPVLLPADRVKG